VAFFGALFAARTDVYAIRFDNQRTGKSGWVPAVRGGRQKGVRHEDRKYLPLTSAVLAAHLLGEVHVGLYPLLDGDKCWWLAADFDGPEAMLDALMYVKAGRSLQVPVALEVPVRGRGARVGVLHLPGPGRDGPPARHRAATRGDGAARPDEPGQLRPVVPVPGPAPGRRGREPDRRPAVQARPGQRSDGLPGPGVTRAARGPVGLPVHPRPDDPGRAQARRGPRREDRRRRRGHPVQFAVLDQDPAAGPAGPQRAARRGHPAGTGGTDPGTGGDAAARSLDAQPGVLRAAADARLHLQHSEVPALLPGDHRRRPGPATWHARHRHLTCRAGRQPPEHHRSARSGRQPGPHLRCYANARSAGCGRGTRRA